MSVTMLTRPLRKVQRGLGMIEVLVALLVLSIGVLGYAGLQLRALNSTDQAQFRSQAVALSLELMERMRTNPSRDPTAVPPPVYDDPGLWPQGPLSNAVPANWNTCIDNVCDSNTTRDWDIAQLSWMAWNNLPQGRMRVEPCAASAATCITVAWDQADPAACNPATDTCVVMEFLR